MGTDLIRCDGIRRGGTSLHGGSRQGLHRTRMEERCKDYQPITCPEAKERTTTMGRNDASPVGHMHIVPIDTAPAAEIRSSMSAGSAAERWSIRWRITAPIAEWRWMPGGGRRRVVGSSPAHHCFPDGESPGGAEARFLPGLLLFWGEGESKNESKSKSKRNKQGVTEGTELGKKRDCFAGG